MCAIWTDVKLSSYAAVRNVYGTGENVIDKTQGQLHDGKICILGCILRRLLLNVSKVAECTFVFSFTECYER